MAGNYQVLLVDDDKEILKIYKQIFKLNGFDIITADDSVQALKILSSQNVAVVVSDVIMPKMDGIQLLKKIKEENKLIQVIMLTAEGSISGAVEAVRAGAFTYMVKPIDIEAMLMNVQKAYELYSVKDENIALKQHILESMGLEPMVGSDPKIKELRDKSLTIASTETTVLLYGESGTGKEILANLIHYQSDRADKTFVRVNCAALAENLLESEMFGHERGAFTGADRVHKGKFEMADKGTLLLDEIGELPLNIQAKLLRVLQEKEFERVGGNTTIRTNFRLIASTNRNLQADMESGLFRKDLFYRINVMPLYIPPLRERGQDILLLIEYFSKKFAEEMKKEEIIISDEIKAAFMAYDWPGNVRELRNVVERLMLTSHKAQIKVSDLPEELKTNLAMKQNPDGSSTLANARKSFEKEYIEAALENNQKNVAKTAAKLGIAKKNLYKKIKLYDINR